MPYILSTFYNGMKIDSTRKGSHDISGTDILSIVQAIEVSSRYEPQDAVEVLEPVQRHLYVVEPGECNNIEEGHSYHAYR